MKRLSNFENVIYDANILVYYCFNTKNHSIIELTKKTHELTNFLMENNTSIIIPKFIVEEIRTKTIRKILEKYISTKQLTNLPKNPNMIFKLGLEHRVKTKFQKLLKKEWIYIENYNPSEELLDKTYDYFDNLETHPLLNKFLKLKKKSNPIPSKNDIKLITFSKERETPIISNDYDITFFADELFQKRLSNQIFNLKELIIYN